MPEAIANRTSGQETCLYDNKSDDCAVIISPRDVRPIPSTVGCQSGSCLRIRDALHVDALRDGGRREHLWRNASQPQPTQIIQDRQSTARLWAYQPGVSQSAESIDLSGSCYMKQRFYHNMLIKLNYFAEILVLCVPSAKSDFRGTSTRIAEKHQNPPPFPSTIDVTRLHPVNHVRPPMSIDPRVLRLSLRGLGILGNPRRRSYRLWRAIGRPPFGPRRSFQCHA